MSLNKETCLNKIGHIYQTRAVQGRDAHHRNELAVTGSHQIHDRQLPMMMDSLRASASYLELKFRVCGNLKFMIYFHFDRKQQTQLSFHLIVVLPFIPFRQNALVMVGSPGSFHTSSFPLLKASHIGAGPSSSARSSTALAFATLTQRRRRFAQLLHCTSRSLANDGISNGAMCVATKLTDLR